MKRLQASTTVLNKKSAQYVASAAMHCDRWGPLLKGGGGECMGIKVLTVCVGLLFVCMLAGLLQHQLIKIWQL